MHQYVFFNGEIRPGREVKISALSSAALYGRCIFTTVALYNGAPFLWEKHWRRLAENAKTVGIDLSGYSEADVRQALADVIKKNGFRSDKARITFFDGSPGPLWMPAIECKTYLLIMTADAAPQPEKFRLGISPYPINSRSPLAGVKSCNYLENLMALDEARRLGFDEAVRLNERGEIAAGCMANLFWLRDKRLYTPSLRTGCLAGTTREFVVENLECEEVTANVETLDDAETIFLTSTGIGIAAAGEFQGRRLLPVPKRIKDLISQKTREP